MGRAGAAHARAAVDAATATNGCFTTPAFLHSCCGCTTGAVRAALAVPRLERAIGVIYRPDTERPSHYFTARLAQQFDVVIHIDETRALEPLEIWARHEVDLPETYPTGV